MKNILILFFTIGTLLSYAQTDKEVQFKKVDGKYHLKIVTMVDGEKKVFDRTYDSIEEMKMDAELEGLKLHVFDKDSNAMFFSDNIDEGDKKVNVFIEESDKDIDDERLHKFKFETNGDSVVNHTIKVWVDDNGNKRIIKDGKEINLNNRTDEEGNEFEYRDGDGHIIIKARGAVGELVTEDGKDIDVNVKVERIGGKDGEKVIIFKSSEDEGDSEKQYVVKIVEEISIHLKDVEGNEFEELLEANSKSLKMDEINYFPNPNSGIFTLAFKADNKPTQVKIIGMDGKEVYSESISRFEGTYNNEINLSGENKGIYLLQILQGKKAFNKKIIIE